jgi:uncharacterized protein (DUF4415 family)
MTEKRSNTTRFRLDPDRPPELTPAQAKRLAAIPIDYTDIPELPEDFWATHRPTKREPKEQITMRLDKTVVGFFRAQGSHYQTRMNDVLRTYVDAVREQEAARVTDIKTRRVQDQTHTTRKAAKALKPRTEAKGRTARSRKPHP